MLWRASQHFSSSVTPTSAAIDQTRPAGFKLLKGVMFRHFRLKSLRLSVPVSPPPEVFNKQKIHRQLIDITKFIFIFTPKNQHEKDRVGAQGARHSGCQNSIQNSVRTQTSDSPHQSMQYLHTVKLKLYDSQLPFLFYSKLSVFRFCLQIIYREMRKNG